MLSHDNLTWTAAVSKEMYRQGWACEHLVSYLPLSHVAAQVLSHLISPSANYSLFVIFVDYNAWFSPGCCEHAILTISDGRFVRCHILRSHGVFRSPRRTEGTVLQIFAACLYCSSSWLSPLLPSATWSSSNIQGSLVETLRAAKPTILFAVPRYGACVLNFIDWSLVFGPAAN